MAAAPSAQRLFSRGSWREVRRIGDILRAETVGGVLLVIAAVVRDPIGSVLPELLA